MAKASPAKDKCINRRIVLKGGAALAAAGPALLRGGYAEAQPQTNRTTALFAYVGAFTTPERKGHGGGINVYRVDPTSGAWSHEQLLEIANPSFLTLDQAQRFLYSVHADLEEASAAHEARKNGGARDSADFGRIVRQIGSDSSLAIASIQRCRSARSSRSSRLG